MMLNLMSALSVYTGLTALSCCVLSQLCRPIYDQRSLMSHYETSNPPRSHNTQVISQKRYSIIYTEDGQAAMYCREPKMGIVCSGLFLSHNSHGLYEVLIFCTVNNRQDWYQNTSRTTKTTTNQCHVQGACSSSI